MARCSGREHPSGLTFAPSTKGRTRCVPNRYCGSRTSIAPNFVCQRSFFTLAMHLRALTNLPLRRLDPRLGPTAQRLPSQQAHLLHNALFRSVGFLQFPLVAFDRQHDRRHPLPKLGMRPQRRRQRLLWRAHGEGHIADAEASAISEALRARRAAFSARRPGHTHALPRIGAGGLPIFPSYIAFCGEWRRQRRLHSVALSRYHAPAPPLPPLPPLPEELV